MRRRITTRRALYYRGYCGSRAGPWLLLARIIVVAGPGAYVDEKHYGGKGRAGGGKEGITTKTTGQDPSAQRLLYIYCMPASFVRGSGHLELDSTAPLNGKRTVCLWLR